MSTTTAQRGDAICRTAGQPGEGIDHIKSVDPLIMRQVMGRFATGVAVVATETSAGSRYAAAVNSLTSVSLSPPLLLACFQQGSQTCDAIAQRGLFSVSVLDKRQEGHSRQFARASSASDAAAALESSHGMPIVADALATLICALEAAHPTGDHVILIGRVRHAQYRDGEPLLFYGSRYHALSSGNADVEWKW